MALGEFKLFQFKSKKQIEKEAKEYALWAFPYGDLQKEKLSALVKELSPKTPVQLSLASFLTCKELYENALENSESRDDAVNNMINVIRSYSQLIKTDEMPLYLALVLADADVDDSCEYPSAEEMRVRIKKLEDMRVKTTFKLFKKKTKNSSDV